MEAIISCCISYFSICVQWPLVCLLTQKSFSFHITFIGNFPGNDSSPPLRFIICLYIILCGHCTRYNPLVDEDHMIPACTKALEVSGQNCAMSFQDEQLSYKYCASATPSAMLVSHAKHKVLFFCVIWISSRKIKLLFGCSEREEGSIKMQASG